MNIPWNRFRLFLLISVFGAALLVLGKVSFLEKSSDFTSKEVRLPESVPLQGWAGRSSTALNDQDSTKPDYLVGREYSYAQNSLILSIQVRYIKPTNGNVKGFIKKYLPSTPLDEEEWEVHTLKGVGSFLLATDRDEIKLSSCLNPYGGSTVSIEEYKRNRNFQDIRYRFIPWLLGENLKDERCLWTHMSISQEGGTSTAMNSLIEDAWTEWYHWWSVQLHKTGT